MSLNPSFLRRHLPFLLAGVSVLLVFLAPDLFAQEEAAGGGEDGTKTLMQKILDAGWFMLPIGILSVLMITLAVFNMLQLGRKKFVPRNLKDAILADMADVRVRSAIEAAAQDPSYLGRMLTMALPNVDATDPETLGRDKVEDAVADFAMRENTCLGSATSR